MFRNANIYTDITEKKLDFSDVTNLSYLFNQAGNITDINITINMTSATKACRMFSGAGLNEVNTALGTLSLLNTSNLEDIEGIFQHCYWFKIINEFDTSNVTNMDYAFMWWGVDRDMITWEIDLSSCISANSIGSNFVINPIKLKNVPKSLGLTSNKNYIVINYID